MTKADDVRADTMCTMMCVYDVQIPILECMEWSMGIRHVTKVDDEPVEAMYAVS